MTRIVKTKTINVGNFLTKEVQKMFKKGVILDVGGNKPYGNWLSSFPRQHQAKYFCLDCEYNVQPHLVGDAHKLPFKNKSIDSVILKAVLEHVRNPFVVISEIERVLRPNGTLLLWVPFLYPYHAAPSYKDYYRFTQDGLEELLKNFSQITIVPGQAYFEMLSGLLPGILGRLVGWPARLLDRFIKIRAQHTGFGALAVK